MAATEGPDSEPWRITPSVQTAPGVYSEELLRGLDFLSTRSARAYDGRRLPIELLALVGRDGAVSSLGGSELHPLPATAARRKLETYSAYTAKFYSNERRS